MSEKKKPPLTEEDARLFRQEVEADAQLQHDKAEPFRQRRKPVPLPPNPDVTGEELDDDFVDMTIETSDELTFMRPGVQNRLFQDLRRGYIRPDDMLDLHGLRVAEARPILAKFLAEARRHKLRVIHIIHGKGYGSEGQQPILKQKINQWLRQRDEVLAFCSAPRFDGGTGAVYVLLSRKERKESWQR
ncbi:MAG: Smr/MutS family protein [Chromatiales bacterium]|nr:Smr/MutS family protein [Chromatiales bacterium]